MPLYDFHCETCDTTSEMLLRSSDTPYCPKCGSAEMIKQLSIPCPPGKSKGIIARARARAAREGHFSNFSAAEQQKLLKP